MKKMRTTTNKQSLRTALRKTVIALTVGGMFAAAQAAEYRDLASEEGLNVGTEATVFFGNSTITAEQALIGSGTITNSGSLFINGGIDAFRGVFEQRAAEGEGTPRTVIHLNEDGGSFFPGTVRLFDGSFETNASFVRNEEEGQNQRLNIGHASAVIKDLTLFNQEQKPTAYVTLLYGDSSLTVRSLNIYERATFGANAGTLTLVNGNSSVSGVLGRTRNPIEVSEAPSGVMTELTQDGGEFQIAASGDVEVRSLNIKNTAHFLLEGQLSVQELSGDDTSKMTMDPSGMISVPRFNNPDGLLTLKNLNASLSGYIGGQPDEYKDYAAFATRPNVVITGGEINGLPSSNIIAGSLYLKDDAVFSTSGILEVDRLQLEAGTSITVAEGGTLSLAGGTHELNGGALTIAGSFKQAESPVNLILSDIELDLQGQGTLSVNSLTLKAGSVMHVGAGIQGGTVTLDEGSVLISTVSDQGEFHQMNYDMILSGGAVLQSDEDQSVSSWTVGSDHSLTINAGDYQLDEILGQEMSSVSIEGSGKLSARRVFVLNTLDICDDGTVSADYVRLDTGAAKLNIEGGTLETTDLSLSAGSIVNIASGGRLAVTGEHVLFDGGTFNIDGELDVINTTLRTGNIVVGETGQLKTGTFIVDADGRLDIFGNVESELFEVSKDGILADRRAGMSGGSYELKDFSLKLNGGEFLTGDTPVEVHSWSIGEGRTLNLINSRYEFSAVDLKAGGTLALENGSIEIGSVQNAGSILIGNGAYLHINELAFGETGGSLTVQDGGTWETSSATLFITALTDGGENNPDGLVYEDGRIQLDEGSTLVLNDENYNLKYSYAAKRLLGLVDSQFLIFTGNLIDADSDETLRYESITSDGIIHDNTIVKISPEDYAETYAVDKQFGASVLRIDSEDVRDLLIQNSVVLTGTTEPLTELVEFGRGTESNNMIRVSGEGKLFLGHEGSENNKGTVSAELYIADGGEVIVGAGDFNLAQVSADAGGVFTVSSGTAKVDVLNLDGGKFDYAGGDLTIGDLILNHGGDIRLSKALTIPSMTVVGQSSVSRIIGSMTVENLTKESDAKALIQIGANSKIDGDANGRGDLTIKKADSLKGLTFFLDPAFEEGKGIEAASRLVYAGTNIDGAVIAGENSYAVFGTEDVAPFYALFSEGTLSWGKNGVRSAVYLGAPITVSSSGGLIVDSKATSEATVTPGAVVFADGSLLAADVRNANGKTLIEAGSFKVAETAKAVLYGVEGGAKYRLTGYAVGSTPSEEDSGFLLSNVMPSSGMWYFTQDKDGWLTANLRGAEVNYGSDLIQGVEIIDSAALKDIDWVNGILDAETVAGKEKTAATLDAAMHPAGAMTVYSTAYDRAGEFRQTVRSEASFGKKRHTWARAVGGKTKYDGIASGAQEIHTKTNAYGVALGAEGRMKWGRLGVAAVFGKGDTKNDNVHGKNDFDVYSVGMYARTGFGGVTLLADGALTYLKSDLSVGGAEKISADVDTAVASLGLQAQKTFELGSFFVTPYVGADLYWLRSDSYDNGRGAKISKTDAVVAEFPIGISVSRPFLRNGKTWITPSLTVSAIPVVGGDIDSKVRYDSAESNYDFTFADSRKFKASFGLNAQTKRLSYGISADYEWGDENRSVTAITARARYAF